MIMQKFRGRAPMDELLIHNNQKIKLTTESNFRHISVLKVVIKLSREVVSASSCHPFIAYRIALFREAVLSIFVLLTFSVFHEAAATPNQSTNLPLQF